MDDFIAAIFHGYILSNELFCIAPYIGLDKWDSSWAGHIRFFNPIVYEHEPWSSIKWKWIEWTEQFEYIISNVSVCICVYLFANQNGANNQWPHLSSISAMLHASEAKRRLNVNEPWTLLYVLYSMCIFLYNYYSLQWNIIRIVNTQFIYQIKTTKYKNNVYISNGKFDHIWWYRSTHTHTHKKPHAITDTLLSNNLKKAEEKYVFHCRQMRCKLRMCFLF